MKIRNRQFDFKNKGYLMGILNVTPDSFSDGGDFRGKEQAIEQALKMVEEGADIIDIGGESTRPGHEKISADEEQKRILPVIEGIRKYSDCVISIDTYKSSTLEKALEAGGDMANDIWGMMKDEKMADIVVKHRCPVVLMHNKDNNHYDNLMEDMVMELQKIIDDALNQGVKRDQIIIDPGIGFALSYEKDLKVLEKLDEIVALDYPLLIGTSRKRFIGRATKVDIAKDRVIGTCATTVWGRMKGASIFRVHDVRANKEALDMVEAIMKGGQYGSN
ncbi:MAG: dihydropteroate synthase [Tissierellia bacterium]|nr:dihydropteroate synthase [Tissierellia bacterium]